MLDTAMADVTELRSFERLAAAAGPVAALKLAAFYGANGSTKMYVPDTIPANHPIALLIGERDAGYLAEELGGQDVAVPSLEMRNLRRAGKLRHFHRLGKSTAQAAPDIGISERQAYRLAKKLLVLEGYDERLIT